MHKYLSENALKDTPIDGRKINVQDRPTGGGQGEMEMLVV
jgi:hypothetical protein